MDKNELSPNGIYAINIYALGMPHTVIIDDYIPTMYGQTPLFANYGVDNAPLYGSLLEKAIAKYNGNYHHVEYGKAYHATSTLIGAPQLTFEHSEGKTTVDELWAEISKHDIKDSIMFAAVKDAPTEGHAFNQYGLVYNHSYTLLGSAQLSNGTRLVKMRNPWGKETFNGNWSDYSNYWTNKFREEVGSVKKDDGIFFMEI